MTCSLFHCRQNDGRHERVIVVKDWNKMVLSKACIICKKFVKCEYLKKDFDYEATVNFLSENRHLCCGYVGKRVRYLGLKDEEEL